ncbi:MAG: hypothetical protein EB084_04400 [Proteobacteria bacterium]|nr:hypothetical protein [Pseudomonadota bacterium]
MKSKLPSIVLGLLMIAGASLTAPTFAKPSAAPPPPDYFPIKDGYWWKYKTTNLDTKASSEWKLSVLGTEKGDDGASLSKLEVDTGSMKTDEWYSKPKGWVMKHRIEYPANNMKGTYTPPDKYLMNPLTPGATWDWSGKGMMDVEASHKDTVKGAETVTVPAGKFTCMRVDTETVQGGQPVHKTYWYANFIGLVKSQTESGNVKNQSELVDYSFKKKG